MSRLKIKEGLDKVSDRRSGVRLKPANRIKTNSKLIDILLRRFVTSQEIKKVREIKDPWNKGVYLISTAFEYNEVTNIIKFLLAGIEITLKYTFNTEPVSIDLRSKVEVKRKRTYHIGNERVSKEEYEKYKAGQKA